MRLAHARDSRLRHRTRTRKLCRVITFSPCRIEEHRPALARVSDKRPPLQRSSLRTESGEITAKKFLQIVLVSFSRQVGKTDQNVVLENSVREYFKRPRRTFALDVFTARD